MGPLVHLSETLKVSAVQGAVFMLDQLWRARGAIPGDYIDGQGEALEQLCIRFGRQHVVDALRIFGHADLAETL